MRSFGLFLKIIHIEKATKFYEIFTLLLTGTTQDKNKLKISQNFVAFSEYMNFTCNNLGYAKLQAEKPIDPPRLCNTMQYIVEKELYKRDENEKKSRRVSTALLIKSPICSSMYLPILVSRTTYYVGYTQESIDIIPFHPRFYEIFKGMSSRSLMIMDNGN